MGALETYITGEYHFDKRDLREIEFLLGEIVPTFLFNCHEQYAWPYGVPAKDQTKLSISTTAMVLEALLRYGGYFSEIADRELGNIPKSNIIPILGKDDKDQRKDIEGVIVKATNLLLKEIYDDTLHLKQTTSGTYGNDDIFTHAWLVEISCAAWDKIQPSEFGNVAQDKWNKIKDKLSEIWSHKLDQCSSGFSQENLELLFKPNSKEFESRPVLHAFAPLRLIQLIRRIKGKNCGVFDKQYKYFEHILHEQLSFSSIPDSRFDPAELMFCLEGMLLCQKSVVDRTIFDRVLSVLTSVQHENAYWRPVKPFLATDRGLALFPVSVEVANSLLRASAIFDGEQVHDTYGSKSIGQLRRYWQWLRARSVRLPNPEGKDKSDLVGWHSEHVNETSVIHPWETSQVMCFLLKYRNALQMHIARTTLVCSRFHFEPFKNEKWSTLEKRYEPVTSLGDGLCTYKDIGNKYINATDKVRNYSMLLYGPPGTGKTTVAKSIARALSRKLITITVSDFLAGGEAEMESRAKSIFNVLISQPPCVVLFDEIDNFLLDRDTVRYREQDSAFQFMTPGMLTKLNDLRSSEQALFIVATNYEDRIDPAIKRTGRIDNKYLLLPPDLDKRKEMISQLTTIKNDKGESLPLFDRKLSIDELTTLSKASLFLGYNDIEATINIAQNKNADKAVIELSELLNARARTTSLSIYKNRFTTIEKDGHEHKVDSSHAPLNEFICLLALALQAKACTDINGDDLDALIGCAKIIANTDKPNKITVEQIKQHTSISSDVIINKIATDMTTLCKQYPKKKAR